MENGKTEPTDAQREQADKKLNEILEKENLDGSDIMRAKNCLGGVDIQEEL